MTGKGHLMSGTVAAADAIATLHFIGACDVPAAVRSWTDRLIAAAVGPVDTGWRTAVPVALLAAGYYIGLLLPDIDKENSMMARRLHICVAVNHRGVTHSVWALMIPFLASLGAIGAAGAFPRGVFLGMLVHCFVDALSVAGWVPFYPLGRYKIYNGTVMTRRRGHFGWYSSARPGSEAVVNGMFVIASICVFGFLAYLRYWPK